MYKQYYRLKEEPFNITPDPAFFFLSPSHKEALASILYGVQKRKGFLSITGEVGSGKTTVLRAYLDQADTETIKVVYLFNPNLSFKDLLETILRELGFPASSSEIFEMVNHLGHVLVQEFRQNRNIVLLIDEAQNIPMETLESLRMLSNLETASSKLIQIVLAGQPELDNMLNRHELRQLRQRIAVRVVIRPLTSEESFQYIQFRLQKAARKKTEVFTPAALKEIVREAAGIPRVLNILCDNCLISGYGYQQKPITPRIAREVIADFRSRRAPSLLRWRYAAAAVLLVSLGLWGMLTYGGKAPLDEYATGMPEKTVVTEGTQSQSLASAVVPSPAPEAAAANGTQTPSIPRQAATTPSPADETAPVGQGGPAEGSSASNEPREHTQIRPLVKTKLAKGIHPVDGRRSVPHDGLGTPAATGESPSREPHPAAPVGRASEEKVSVGPNRQVSPNVSSPPVEAERPAGLQGGDRKAHTDSKGEAPADASPPVVDSQKQAAGQHDPEDPRGMDSGAVPVEAPAPETPAEAAAQSSHTGPDLSEPWSRARTLFEQGRIAEAGAIWQSTYLDSSADRIAIEVELNCEPQSLAETFEMLSAPEDFYILPYRHQGKLCYRVRLGPYTSWTEAASRARQIKGAMWYVKPRLKKLVISSDGG